MADINQWRPAMGAHAIIAASVAVTFKESVNDKPWRRIEEAISKVGYSTGLRERQPIQMIEVKIGPGQPATSASTTAFELIRRINNDVVEKLQVQRNGLTLENHQYTRWRPMKERASTLLGTAYELFAESVEISAISASYTDGFRAITPGIDVDCSQVINPSSSLVAQAAFNPMKPWHTHSGWFSYNDDEPWRRILSQVNIDVADAIFPEGNTRVAQIVTTVADQYNQAGLSPLPQDRQTWQAALESLQSSHDRLKTVLGLVLNNDAQSAISLRAK